MTPQYAVWARNDGSNSKIARIEASFRACYAGPFLKCGMTLEQICGARFQHKVLDIMRLASKPFDALQSVLHELAASTSEKEEERQMVLRETSPAALAKGLAAFQRAVRTPCRDPSVFVFPLPSRAAQGVPPPPHDVQTVNQLGIELDFLVHVQSFKPFHLQNVRALFECRRACLYGFTCARTCA